MTISTDATGDILAILAEVGEAMSIVVKTGMGTYTPATGVAVPTTSSMAGMRGALLNWTTKAQQNGPLRRVRRAYVAAINQTEITPGSTLTDAAARKWLVVEAEACRVAGSIVAWALLLET